MSIYCGMLMLVNQFQKLVKLATSLNTHSANSVYIPSIALSWIVAIRCGAAVELVIAHYQKNRNDVPQKSQDIAEVMMCQPILNGLHYQIAERITRMNQLRSMFIFYNQIDNRITRLSKRFHLPKVRRKVRFIIMVSCIVLNKYIQFLVTLVPNFSICIIKLGPSVVYILIR